MIFTRASLAVVPLTRVPARDSFFKFLLMESDHEIDGN
jgi:hypothetical protein